MAIETIEFKGKKYPKFQSEGYAAQFAIPYAKHICKGRGLDVGCMHTAWSFPGSIPIDISFNHFDENGRLIEAMNLPEGVFDYIFSSNLLEHLPSWVDALDYWYNKLRKGGSLYLYLPHYNSVYWRSWNNRKHIHDLNPTLIEDYLVDRGWGKIFTTEYDLNNCFHVMAEKI